MKSRTSGSRGASAGSAGAGGSARAPGTGSDRLGTGTCLEWARRTGTEAASLADGCLVVHAAVCAVPGTMGSRPGSKIGIGLDCSKEYFAVSGAEAIKAVH